MESINKVESNLIRSIHPFIEKELRPFLKIPSYTRNKQGIKEAKEFIISYINDFADEISEYQGITNPLILANVEGKAKDKLLIYMMYDTQPINNEIEWISNPFGAEIHTLESPLDMLGECIIARGAYNSKTPLISFLNVVREFKRSNELPISLLLLFDGEEEIGSPTLFKFIEEKKELFKDSTDAYYPSTKQDLTGKSIIKLGYKGILSLTITVSTKNKEPHSAYSAMIPNPATDLISLLGSIYSNGEFQIETLKKPYEMTKEEILVLNELIKKLDLQNIKKKVGIQQTRENDPKSDFINYLFNPTFNISTLKSGFLEEGSKNYVPNKAICNLDIRFAHTASANKVFEEIKEKIDEFTKSSNSNIELVKHIGYESSRVSKDSILVESLIKSANKLEVETEIWPISAAAAPLSKIQEGLGLNFITGGLGIGGSAHSANEFIQCSSIINSRLSYFYFLQNYSQLNKERAKD
ncbi:MAG: M20/M25/M40 family metallo-hydrolase [Candidatus Lokiarchaeota archaeon]|nr:M20/M25/M40 family metallo-hydrolase [Candidatus Lokiarchaeota archaeon]